MNGEPEDCRAGRPNRPGRGPASPGNSLRFLCCLLLKSVCTRVLAGAALLILLWLLPGRAHAQGGTPLWTNFYNGPVGSFWDEPNAIAVDASCNVYVAGGSTRTGTDIDYATIACSSAGVPLWTNWYDGWASGHDYGTAVAVDANGNVYVTGFSQELGWDKAYDIATIAYSSAGVPLWVSHYNEPWLGHLVSRPMAVDASGNVVVLCESVSSSTSSDYVTIKYSSVGVPLWTNRCDGVRNEYRAVAVAVDASGNAFVTGFGDTNSDMTIGYSSTGVPLWTNRYNGRTAALAVDASGNVYVTGSSWEGSGGFATVKYAAMPPAPPVITHTVLAGTNLVFAGTSGSPGSSYYVLASANVAAGMNDWVRLATNTFGADGTFTVTNAVDPAKGQQFFRVFNP